MGWFSRDRAAPRDPGECQKPAMQPIKVDSWSTPDNALRTLCITQADWAIRWHLTNHYGVDEPEYQRQGAVHKNGEPFDVYLAAIPGGSREYWINVSYWYGRGILMEPGRLNAPVPGNLTNAVDFFGGYELQILPFNESFLESVQKPLRQIGVRPASYSSEQLFDNVAFITAEAGQPVVQFTVVRRFLSESLPLLHGFRFVKPFIVHQIMHLLVGEDTRRTEAIPRPDYAKPRPGTDCVPFTPPELETPANDFWKYMLSAHKPRAFESEPEQRILVGSAMTAISEGFVTGAELADALHGLNVTGPDGEILRDLTSSWGGDGADGGAQRTN